MDIKTKLVGFRNKALLDQLANYIENAELEGLYHIPVYELAEKWNISKKDIVNLMIYGVHSGVFTMEWIFHCPTCGGIAEDVLTLHNATRECRCDMCKIDFTNKVDENIEVFFSIHPEIKSIPILEYKEKYKQELIKNLQEGISWIQPYTIKAVDILMNNTFRELLKDEILPENQSLEITKCCILFTDIKGSTKLYNDIGDSKAFQLVLDHFKILFEEIRKYEGVPIKTMGDGVMGIFPKTEYALKAAMESQRRIIEYFENRNEKVQVKMGLHSGQTLVVTLNERIDYFGSTVNLASRISSQADANEVLISEDVFNSGNSKKIIAQYARTIKKTRQKFKGLEGEYNIYHILFS